MNLKVHYQLGIDTYTTHFQDVFDYGRNGGTGMLDNYGISSSTVNSLLTANYDWKINSDLNLSAMVGSEFNQGNYKTYSEHGEDFNFGGWSHIRNANIVTANESKKETVLLAFSGVYHWIGNHYFSLMQLAEMILFPQCQQITELSSILLFH